VAAIMQLDLPNPSVESTVEDIRPIALRKRRRSATTSTSPYNASIDKTPIPKTPSQRNKKARASDPGLFPSSKTTGLTSFVKRTSLQPNDHIYAACAESPSKTLRRPVSQLLDARTSRRIARSRASEAMNNAALDKRVIDKQAREIKILKEELELFRRASTSLIPIDRMDTDSSDNNEATTEDNQSLTNNNRVISPSDEQPIDHADPAGIYMDPDCRSDQAESVNTQAVCNAPVMTDKQVQTSHTSAEQASQLETHLETQAAYLYQARMELERMLPGETTLSLFPPADADCAPLLSAILRHLRTSLATIQTTRSSLRACEEQQSNLRNNFEKALANLEATRESHATLLKGAQAGAEKYAQARAQIAALESDLTQAETSVTRLRGALKSYREEAKSMENMIVRLEDESNTKLRTLKNEMSDTIAKLQDSVVEETRGRREAEEHYDALFLQIRVLQHSERELKDTVSEKQHIIRLLEEEIADLKTGKAKEEGCLDKKISIIEAAIKEENQQLQRDKSLLQQDVSTLNNVMITRKQLEINIIGDLRKAIQNIQTLIVNWEAINNNEGGIRIGGLMTPSMGTGRFRDCATESIEGAVQIDRGRGRHARFLDSDISLPEEDVLSSDI
jgi:chromosome segregation ATPase